MDAALRCEGSWGEPHTVALFDVDDQLQLRALRVLASLFAAVQNVNTHDRMRGQGCPPEN